MRLFNTPTEGAKLKYAIPISVSDLIIMACSAAMIALSLGTVSTWSMGLLYIAIFGIGSIVGMVLLTVAITVPLRRFSDYLAWLHNGVTGLVGGFSCALGGAMFYQIGVVEELMLFR